MRAKSYALLLGGTCLVLAGCLSDAPRENPLDPESDEYESASVVTGRVTNRLGEGVSGAHVQLQAEGLETTSNVEGSFALGGVPAGTVRVTARKQGFAPAHDSLALRPDENRSVLLPINALPEFDSINVRSVHTHRFFPEPTDLFELVVEASVRDPDALPGLDTVVVRISDSEAFQLEQVEAGHYVRSFRTSELPVENLQALQGQPIRIEAADEENNRVRSSPRYLARVIEASPVADTVVVQDSLHFRWQPSAGEAAPYPFPHTYRVTLYRREDDFNPRLARYAGLAPETMSLTVQKPDPGSYYWTVSVMDALGNRSRSRPYAFSIE